MGGTMFKRILVPLDGSPEGEAVLPEALRLSSTAGEIFLLHAAPAVPPPSDAPVRQMLEVPERALAYLDSVRERLTGRRATALVRHGDAAEEIAQAAQELGADLIALTTHGRSGLSRLLMGSVAEAVVRRSSLPLLIMRPGRRSVPGGGLREILVPLDDTERSVRILEIVKPLAVETGCDVRLLHVIVPIVVGVPPAGILATVPATEHDPQPRLRELARPLEAAGIRVRTEVASGYAAVAILGHAREAGSDLIAMATSAKRGLSRIFLGSVAQSVLREADRPVLLLRVPW
jgi:nucleotide-binding universal stress UspA family protein